MGVGCCLVKILRSASLESSGTPWPMVVYGREVVRELSERVPDGVRVLLRVRSEAIGDAVGPPGPAPEHVDKVVGVLRLAAVGECERLEDDEGSRSAHGNAAAHDFPRQCVTVQDDFVAFIEREFQSGCYESTKVALKVVDPATSDSAWDRRQQEVDCHAEVREPSPDHEGAVPGLAAQAGTRHQAAERCGIRCHHRAK